MASGSEDCAGATLVSVAGERLIRLTTFAELGGQAGWR